MSIVFIILAFFAYRLRMLTFFGALTAVMIGGMIYHSFHINGILLLGIFFITSSLLSFIKNEVKEKTEEITVKGSRRDVIQVLANGGVPFVLSILASFTHLDHTTAALLLSIAIASANADTWASEVGTLSKKKPRLLLNFKKVEPGTSGAVSLVGTIAALLGSFVIAFTSSIMFSYSLETLLIITLAGFISHLVDGVLGATLQVSYQCSICHKITEKTIHCQRRTVFYKGIRFITNDFVNFSSIFVVTVVSYFTL